MPDSNDQGGQGRLVPSVTGGDLPLEMGREPQQEMLHTVYGGTSLPWAVQIFLYRT